MNQNTKQLVPVCYLLAVVIFCFIVGSLVKPAIEDYQTAIDNDKRSQNELTTVKERLNKSEQELKNEKIHLESIKQVYQTNVTGDTADSLVMFGKMFDEIINRAQRSGLLIRSIEYDMKPVNNAIYNNFSEQYNTCELKFFLVGKYPDLRDFLDKINNDFQYLLSISKLNITAFNGNTDYILISMNITLYSKKPVNTDE